MTSSSFLESVFWLLSRTETRVEFGHDCLIMLALLVNFEKDRPNACAVRLSLVDDPLILNGYSQVIKNLVISAYNLHYAGNQTISLYFRQ